jgi:hypothetical protein
MNQRHYQHLGIATTATAVEIKKAYHQMSLKHHPDRNQATPESRARYVCARCRQHGSPPANASCATCSC